MFMAELKRMRSARPSVRGAPHACGCSGPQDLALLRGKLAAAGSPKLVDGLTAGVLVWPPEAFAVALG